MINRKKDIDQIIQQALTPMEPSYECNKNLKKRMADKMRNQQIQKRGKTGYISGKLVAAAVVCCLMIGTVSVAASKAAAYFGKTSGPVEFTTISQKDESEKQVGYHVKTVEKFSNGYELSKMSVDTVNEFDEYDSVTSESKEMGLTYKKAGEDDLHLNTTKITGVQEESGAYEDSKEIEGILVKYYVDTYKWVPVGYERTKEDIANEQKGNYFISVGADEVSENKISYAEWEQDGILYNIMNVDHATDAEVLFGMAAELIRAE